MVMLKHIVSLDMHATSDTKFLKDTYRNGVNCQAGGTQGLKGYPQN